MTILIACLTILFIYIYNKLFNSKSEYNKKNIKQPIIPQIIPNQPSTLSKLTETKEVTSYNPSKKYQHSGAHHLSNKTNTHIDKPTSHSIHEINNYNFKTNTISNNLRPSILKESNTSYCDSLNLRYNQAPYNFSFETIRSLSRNCNVHAELNSGVTILSTENQLLQYIYSYGLMHQAKLKECFGKIIGSSQNLQLNGQNLEIIDYGCGQGLGTMVLLDYLKLNYNSKYSIKKVVLIEPSLIALKRASLHVEHGMKHKFIDAEICTINKKLSQLNKDDIVTSNSSTKIHLFSNILDIADFNINLLCSVISASQHGVNYFACVSPNINYTRNLRLDEFFNYFNSRHNCKSISHITTDVSYDNGRKTCKRYERSFKVHFN